MKKFPAASVRARLERECADKAYADFLRKTKDWTVQQIINDLFERAARNQKIENALSWIHYKLFTPGKK